MRDDRRQKSIGLQSPKPTQSSHVEIVAYEALRQLDGADADALQAVQPEVGGMRGLKARRGANGDFRRRFAAQEALVSVGAQIEDATIGRIDEGAVVGAE